MGVVLVMICFCWSWDEVEIGTVPRIARGHRKDGFLTSVMRSIPTPCAGRALNELQDGALRFMSKQVLFAAQFSRCWTPSWEAVSAPCWCGNPDDPDAEATGTVTR